MLNMKVPKDGQLVLHTLEFNSIKVQPQLKNCFGRHGELTGHSSSPWAGGILQPRRRKETFVPKILSQVGL